MRSAIILVKIWIPLYEEYKNPTFDMMNVYCSSFNQDSPREDSKRSLIRPKNNKPLTGKSFGLVLSFVDIACVVQDKSLGKCPPTPSLTYHSALGEILVLTLI